MNRDAILNAVPRYGNFGGPNYGGDYDKLQAGQPGYNPTWGEYTWVRHNGEPINGQDAIYEAHDQGYSKAEIRLANNEITAEQANYEKLKIDVKLLSDLVTYSPLFDMKVTVADAIEAIAYRDNAMKLFTMIAMYRAAELLSGTLSSAVRPLLNSLLNGSEYSDLSDFDISGFCPGYYNSAQFVRPRVYDPLTLDLDGDGIETIAVSLDNPIVFDHDGDGLKTGTGWISQDDGLLAMDRNDNGTIDDGTELFGDSTPLNAGGNAIDGFAALAQEDTNLDGAVNNLDANWSNLRVWHDLNSDAISQTDELLTMEQAGIAELNVSSVAHSQVLANGNQIADLGTYTKTDGTTATMGEVSDMADINLTIDTFNREFPDEIPVSEEVAVLPDMEGSGLVRDLQEAAGRLLKTAHVLRCAAAVGVATYTQNTSRFSGFARLASERF